MPFTVTDFHDLVRLLYDYPEWRAEIRRLVLTDEILELPALVRQLGEEQRAFAEAQRRTEERVGRLEIAMAELAEAQRRTEISLQKLSESHAKLEKEFGQFKAIFGATVEDEASGVLRSVLEEKGYRPLGESFNLALDGELDVVLPVATPDREILWAVVEAKARLSQNDVRAWADRMKSEGWQRRLAKRQVTGPYLVYAFGIRVDRSAIEEAQRQGIGLLTGQGERVAPKGWIVPESR
ncbi:MAG: hypothetical protein N2383_00665 [Caldilineales bacterium]|nr:hypothetical protein [Caldilineales bacterium]